MPEQEPPGLAAARALVEAGQAGEATRLLRSLLEEDLPAPRLRDVALLAERAGAAMVAIGAWKLLLDATGDTEPAGHLLSLSRATGDLAEALRLARELRGRDPGEARWVREEVEVLLDLGREDEARQVVEDLRRASPAPCALCDELEDLLATRGGGDGIIEEFEDGGGEAPGAERRVAEPPPSAWTPPDGDIVRFLHLFGGREDVHSRMWISADGRTGYQPVRHPMSAADVRNHLLGNVTLGTYPVRLDGTTRFFVIDLDLRKEALESAAGDAARARELRETVRRAAAHVRLRLAGLGLDAVEESSGFKGRHFWVFLDPPLPAGRVHALGPRLLAFIDPREADIGLEFFPKQGAKKGRLGNLVKLPLGIHLRTGRRSLLLDGEGRPLADPWRRLREARALDEEGFSALEKRLAEIEPRPANTGRGIAAADEESKKKDAGPPLPRPVDPPPWTEADFELDPPVRAVLAGCVILRRIVDRVRQEGRGTKEMITALRATLGHLPRGVEAVNWLLDRMGNVPREQYLVSRLRGNPVSCQKLRGRFPAWGALPGCSCDFSDRLAPYPTPVLHADAALAGEEAPAAAGGDLDPEREARRLGWLVRRAREIEEELAEVRRSLLAWMRERGVDEVRLPEGAWARRMEGGVESLEWVPADGAGREGAPGEDGDPP